MIRSLPNKYLILFLLVFLVVLGIIFYLFFLLKNQTSTTRTMSSRPQFFCPVTKEFCDKGKILRAPNGNQTGIGYSLPVGTPILAAFNGQASGSRTTLLKSAGGGVYPSISVTGENQLQAVYVFTGQDYNGIKNVERGEVLTLTGTNQIGNFEKINLIISFYQILTETDKNLLNINPSDLAVND